MLANLRFKSPFFPRERLIMLSKAKLGATMILPLVIL